MNKKRFGLTSVFGIIHIVIGLLALVFGGLAGENFFFEVLGFPLIFSLDRFTIWLNLELRDIWRPVGVALFVAVWVVNSYLWGFVAATVVRFVARCWRNPKPPSA